MCSTSYPALAPPLPVGARGYKAPKKAAPSSGDRKKKGGVKDADSDNPRLRRIIALLQPEPSPNPSALTPEQRAAFAAQHKAYKDRKTLEMYAWRKDIAIKHKLQLAAIKALPERLRRLAQQPDHAPFPLNRQFLLETPPEAYRDK